MFNFNLKKTAVFQAAKQERFPLFKFAKFFSQLFLFLFILSLLLVFFSFMGAVSSNMAVKTPAIFLALWLLFWDISLFTDLKIKRPEMASKISDAVLDIDNYNLAEFLSLQSAKIAGEAINFCRKRKIAVNSTSLFYSAVKASKEIAIISFRLGLNAKKLQEDLKNYLEKTQKQPDPTAGREGPEPFSEDFQNTIKEAANISNARGRETIGEKEILAALAKHDEFFKKVLIDADLKNTDIENLTLWLDSAENLLEKSKQFWTYENLLRQGSLGKDWASGYTITLDQFAIDWRRVVSKWAVREIIGHQKEIEQSEMVLARSNMSNVLLVGDQGTGRKSIVEAIAQKCYLGASLPELNNKRVVELDLVTLIARIQDPEKLEAILDQIFSEVVASGNVILAIDELQNFVGQSQAKPGVVDISGILSKYLPIPNFQFIAITDYSGLHKNIEANPSFAQFFRKIEVSEITESETIRILQSAALELEYKSKILILYPSIREIVNLTGRYMPSLPFPKKALDVLDETAVYIQTLKEKVVMPHHVAKIISDKTEIPVGKMDVKEKEVLLNLEDLIHKRIINQQEAVKEISIAMRRARAGIASKKRPMGTFLFLGPTGVGKTETSKALAQIYFGSEDKMIRIDMSEFQAISDIPRLVGAVSPIEMQGLLTTPVRETPFSLILLDEVEKAHPNILNLFLQVLDEGHITDGQGRKVVFTNTIIICTSNAGAEMIFEAAELGRAVEKDALLEVLFQKQIFRPEFINRFDAAVIFKPLTKDNLLKISELMLQSLQKNLKEKEIDFEITEPLKEKIVELSYKPAYGAREMRRVIQNKVENVVAQALLTEKLKKADKFEIDPENFELLINSTPS